MSIDVKMDIDKALALADKLVVNADLRASQTCQRKQIPMEFNSPADKFVADTTPDAAGVMVKMGQYAS